ncbi:histidinol-phosphate transaminase [Alkaliphilus transvaalensis]|uniref:histidinol-phosphate transaminase n=1 Tax=Alkaliphilus transvaalensis TaxID=114628 RepID=UPI0006877E6C|nr:histidinol-phosphate transaminase [Alkaliphilus transvaalensis]
MMINTLVRNKVKDLSPYNPIQIESLIKLDANENNYTSTLLTQKIVKALTDVKINQYPDSNADGVKSLLAQRLKVSKDQIVVGCGSDQLIFMILSAFINEGDKMLTTTPTFSMYKISNKIVGGETIEVPLKEDFKLDYFQFMRAIKKVSPKVIFLSNPNNPTGGVIPREQIIKIVELSNAIVVVDEAYYEFYQESMMDLVNYYPNLIVLRTLSKAYGLAGARIGYAVASKEMSNILNKVKPPYNISSLDQVAARVCLENCQMVEGVIAEIIEEKNRLSQELTKLTSIRVYESYGNFILIKTINAKELYQFLLNEGVAVRYFGNGNEGLLTDCLRISIGNKIENRTLMKLINTFYSKEQQNPFFSLKVGGS